MSECHWAFRIFFKSTLIIFLYFLPLKVTAQIAPDRSLGTENSAVNSNQIIEGIPSTLIEGGARRDNNLFHSFEEFNIGLGQGAYFANPVGVENILSRITGSRPSEIFGTLGVLGGANLFFLNPNGIIFGPNASLDLNGSFLATTADSVYLSNGTIFSAKTPQPVPLLRNHVPIGLGFAGNPGKIQVQGTGHGFLRAGDFSISFFSEIPKAGLEGKPEQTIALVGGEVNLSGGTVTAPSGRIEIGGVASGQVRIVPLASGGFALNYDNATSLKNLVFSRLSLLNASGEKQGDIQVFGRDITLTDSSLFLIQNLGERSLGNISINAENSLTITGVTESVPIFSDLLRFDGGIRSQSLEAGKGADINIFTKHLILQSGARIYLENFASGESGNLTLEAAESVQLFGNLPFDPSFPVGSFISIGNLGSGRAGKINLTTKHLSVQGGSLINSTVLGIGPGGDLKIEASESIEVTGFNANSLIPSIISSSNQGSGRGGSLSIDTRRLTLRDGGRVDASTLAAGAAGNLTIKATDLVEVSGTIPGSINPSLITSSANRVDPAIQKVLGLPEIPTGTSGSVTIETRQLRVTDGALVSVNNDGFGNAGSLDINADTIILDNRGGITAATPSGEGGNITIKSSDIELSNGGQISATAGGTGNGGNIAIDTERLFVLDGSAITAQAFRGQGGQIDIEAKLAIVSPDSLISASSELGIDGTVELDTQEAIQRFAFQPFKQFLPAEDLIAQSCLARTGQPRGTFVYGGTGGLPVTPDSGIDPGGSAIQIPAPAQEIPTTSPEEAPAPSQKAADSSRTVAIPADSSDSGRVVIRSSQWKLGDPIVEPTARIRTADGRILLVADLPPSESPVELLESICQPARTPIQ